jgi:hypothetical protein
LRIGGIVLLLDNAKLALDQLKALVFPFKFTTQAFGKRSALGGGQLAEIIRVRRRFGSIPRMPWANSSPLMRVDMASTLSDQALAMGTASVFLFDRGHPHNGAKVALATVDGDESPQQGEQIDPIGLHSAGPAIDLDACRIEDAAVERSSGFRVNGSV